MDYGKISGSRIRAAREMLGLDQAALAAIVGVAPSAIGNYEQGTRYPKPPIMARLSKAMDIPVGYLGGLEPDKQLEALLLIYSSLDQRGRATLHGVAESQLAAIGPRVKPADE